VFFGDLKAHLDPATCGVQLSLNCLQLVGFCMAEVLWKCIQHLQSAFGPMGFDVFPEGWLCDYVTTTGVVQ